MCGFAGVLHRAPLPEPCKTASRLSESLAHRGPDDAGLLRDAGDRLLLVHRRLAIIDPSPSGHQPMATPDGRHWMVFNGEVYNFRALRAALERDGESFATDADTEVLLRLIVRRGPAALADVRGMFALAVWDAREETLLVARDRFGIKPLYVAASPEGIAFASELRALVAGGLVAWDPDPAGVLGFLRWGSVPVPLTWLRGVSALEPGTWGVWRASGEPAATGRFADVREAWVKPAAAASARALREQTRAALVDSVMAHLVADVPVGVFLSGGIDSAAILSAAHAAGGRLHTYTVVVAEDAFSEADAARRVAERFEAVHHTLHVDAAAVARDWPVILRHLDQPTIDGVNTFYAARAVAATGVKAVLSGVGGDELFGGYPSFWRLPRARGVARGLGPILPLAARLVGGLGRNGRAARRRQIARAGANSAEIYRGLRGFLMPCEVERLAGPRLADRAAAERVAAAEASACAAAGEEAPAATAARLETTVYLRHQLLRDIDVMSMAHGLEVRVPLVDASLLAAVWPALGAHRALVSGKRLLVEAAPHPIPSEVALAPKRTFTLPFELWMRGALAEPIRSGLADLAADGWIRPDAPAEIWRDWEQGRVHWSRVWGLGVLGRFLRDG